MSEILVVAFGGINYGITEFGTLARGGLIIIGIVPTLLSAFGSLIIHLEL